MKRLLLPLLISVTGCTVGPTYVPPEMEVPCEWHGEHSKECEQDSIDGYKWWEALNDPLLNSLIERGISENLDVQIAMTRIMEARLSLKGGEANLYPRLDATASYTYATFNQKTLNNILGYGNCGGNRQRNLNLFEAGFDAEWEIDLFGMRAHQNNALRAMAEASQEDFSNVIVTLTAEIAKTYIELRGLQQRLLLIDENIRSQQDTKELTVGLVAGGFAGTLDELQVDDELNQLISQKPQVATLIDRSVNHLSILLGMLPGDLYCELAEATPLPELPCYQPMGIPSELLRRRPDIRKAERELAAATEEVGTAIAALFPRISLTGFIGDITTFCSTGSLTGFAGPQLLLPIFNSRLLKQDVCYNKIKVQQSMLQYQKTVLEALEETENAISTFHNELEKKEHLKRIRQSSESAYQLSMQLYQSGLKNYLEVRIAQRSYLGAESALLQSRIDALVDYIALYKALGGGWHIFSCDESE